MSFEFIVKADDGDVKPEKVDNSHISRRKTAASHLHCPGVLLGLGCHCSSTHFDCHWQHGSQEKPTKILTIVIHCCVL